MAELLSPRALCTLDDVSFYVDPTNAHGATRDDRYIRLINAASTKMYRVARREFVAINAVRNPSTDVVTAAAQTREFDGYGVDSDGEFEIGDLMTFTSMAVDGVAILDASAIRLPRVRDEWEPITRVRIFHTIVGRYSTITVTGVWGFPKVPEDIRETTIELVKYWIDTNVEPRSETYDEYAPPAALRRSLPTWAWDTAVSYRRKSRLTSLRIGS